MGHGFGVYLLAREVDAHGAAADEFVRDLELVSRHAADDHIAQRQTILQLPPLPLLDLMHSPPQPRTAGELLDVGDVHTEDLGAIVGEQRGQRPTDDFAAIDDGDTATKEAFAVVEEGVVDLQVLEDLDDGQRRAGQSRLLSVVRRVQEAHVLVHVVYQQWCQTLDILVRCHCGLQSAIARGAEDGVVDDDAVDVGGGVGLPDRGLEVLAVELFEREGKSTLE